MLGSSPLLSCFLWCQQSIYASFRILRLKSAHHGSSDRKMALRNRSDRAERISLTNLLQFLRAGVIELPGF